MKRFFFMLLGIALLVAFAFWPRASIVNSGKASVEWLADGEIPASTEFARATEPIALQFPQDFGAHNDYQTEWWYYTGNLATEGGREFGYQLTFFRRALSPKLEKREGSSTWRSNQVYFAHFTLSDIEVNRFYPHERYSRQSVGLSGARSEPYEVWLEDWSVAAIAPGQVRLVAQAEDVSLNLVLNETLKPVLQGNRGYSQKGPEAGNASYYYSIVQQRTEGEVAIGEESYAVKGLSWKDHEYSTSVLSPDTVGWDWFSLQFEDGSALMLFDLRRRDGSITDMSNGTYIAADGKVQAIAANDWQARVLQTWHSPHSDVDYPSRWHIEIPDLQLILDGKPKLADQELNLSATTYWEGAVVFSGIKGDREIAAQGYVELTGYAQQLNSVL